MLLDGHSLAYRAFFALPAENFTTAVGQPTNAVYGFTSMLANTVRDEAPTHLAVAFDVSRKTWRSERYAEYKATRSATPDAFKGQVELIGELLDAMGVPRFALDGYEADDIIATLATRAADDGFDQVLIVTGDRDNFQLVTDRVTVLYPTKGVSELTRYTPAMVEERYGLTPERYPDFAALRGDPSDNLPGIPGVGEKTATKWIQQFGSLHDLLERADEVKGKAGQNLRDHLESVRLNRELTEMVRDVALPSAPRDLARRPYDRDAVTVLLDSLEFRNASLRERLFGIDPGADTTETEPTTTAEPELDGTVVAAGELAPWLARHGEGPLGLATVDSWSLGSGTVHAVALAAADGPAVWFDPAELDEADDAAFAAWAADTTRPKVVHAAKELHRVLAELGWPLAGVTMDTALAAYLVQPGRRSFQLEPLSLAYLGREPGPAAEPAGQLALDAGDGAEADALMRQARTILDLAVPLEERLREGGGLELLHTVELPTSELLARMERAGIAADRAWLDGLEQQFAGAVQQSVAEAHRSVGHEFNLGSPKQLQEVLFGELGLPRTKRTKTGYTTDADALTWLATQTEHELPVLMLRHREQARLRTTVEGLIKSIAPDGRIHTSFSQTVAATGRLSSTEPNLQNVPVRTAEGRAIRRGFVVGEGYASLLTADYSQIELRVMAHLSDDAGLREAFTSGEDLHDTVASQVFDVSPENVDPEMRRKTKAMSYGLAYGLSAFGLAQQLSVSPEEARRLMDTYFERFGGVRDYLQRVVQEARVVGYTETLQGRRRYLPDLTSSNRQRREMAERMALNAPIQGTAADIVKVAMLRVDGALRAAGARSRLLLQVHDEIVVEVAHGEADRVEEIVRREMAGAADLGVPLDVSVGHGDTWEAAAH